MLTEKRQGAFHLGRALASRRFGLYILHLAKPDRHQNSYRQDGKAGPSRRINALDSIAT